MPTPSPTPVHPQPRPVVYGALRDQSPFVFPRSDDELVKNGLIMIIDDDEATTLAIRKHLQLAGFRNFEIVTDSSQALVEVYRHDPDVILLDLFMPVNGLKILQKIRENEETRHLPVLTLTSNDDQVMRTTLLNLGANDFLQKPISADELVARVRNILSAKIAYDQLATRSKKLQADILQDSLTGVANRRAFDFELNRKMIEWERQRTPVALLLLDIDHFKKVNDHYGHQVGDVALQRVAEAIRHSTRKMDLVCRVGGEEFAVILPVTRNCQSYQTAERIRQEIESMVVTLGDLTLKMTVSIGIANAMKGDDAHLLFRRADTALYTGKQRGRNCSTFHDGSQCIAIEDKDNNSLSPCRPFKDPVDVNISAAGVMIIDDEPSTVAVVKKYLSQGGFERINTETDSCVAFDRICEVNPDIILLDIRMPETDGLSVLEAVRNNEGTRQIPVVFLTSSTDTVTKVKALNLGANDFLHKPVNASELLARVRNTLMAKAHVDLMAGYSVKLEHEVKLRTAELVASRREAIQCLARAAELRDDKTGHHVLRVGRYAAIIAAELGFSAEQVVDLEHAAQLHDVGKIGVPDAILNKPDRLTEEEFEAIKDHCRAGSQIIRDDSRHAKKAAPPEESMEDFLGECSSPVMRLAALVAETHHEKWDGSGYPRGLSGEDIPLEGRITAVCDVFDAVSTARPYKKAFPLDECFKIITEGRGTHFDPNVVDAFFARREEVIRAFHEFTDLAH